MSSFLTALDAMIVRCDPALPVALWQVLLCLAIAGAILRLRSQSIAAAVLLANWGLCKIAIDGFDHDQYIWPILALIDFLSAAIMAGPSVFRLVLGFPVDVSRAGALICISYGVELMAHSVFGLVEKTDAAKFYWWYATHYAAWVQAYVVAAWEIWGGGHRQRDHGRRRDRYHDRRLYGASVGSAVARKEE